MGNEKARAELELAGARALDLHRIDWRWGGDGPVGCCSCGANVRAAEPHQTPQVLDSFLAHPDALIDLLVESGVLEEMWTDYYTLYRLVAPRGRTCERASGD